MRRSSTPGLLLVGTLIALGACAGDPPAEEAPAEESEVTTSTPALPGSRAIDRARGAAAAASDRAQQHDTIR